MDEDNSNKEMDIYIRLNEESDNIGQKKMEILLVELENSKKIIQWGINNYPPEKRIEIINKAQESPKYTPEMVNSLVECHNNWGTPCVSDQHIHLFAGFEIMLYKIKAPHERKSRIKAIHDLILGGNDE